MLNSQFTGRLTTLKLSSALVAATMLMGCRHQRHDGGPFVPTPRPTAGPTPTPTPLPVARFVGTYSGTATMSGSSQAFTVVILSDQSATVSFANGQTGTGKVQSSLGANTALLSLSGGSGSASFSLGATLTTNPDGTVTGNGSIRNGSGVTGTVSLRKTG